MYGRAASLSDLYYSEKGVDCQFAFRSHSPFEAGTCSRKMAVNVVQVGLAIDVLRMASIPVKGIRQAMSQRLCIRHIFTLCGYIQTIFIIAEAKIVPLLRVLIYIYKLSAYKNCSASYQYFFHGHRPYPLPCFAWGSFPAISARTFHCSSVRLASTESSCFLKESASLLWMLPIKETICSSCVCSMNISPMPSRSHWVLTLNSRQIRAIAASLGERFPVSYPAILFLPTFSLSANCCCVRFRVFLRA